MTAQGLDLHTTPDAEPRGGLVACLCAQWCNTCQAYRDVFEQLRLQAQAKWGAQLTFIWVDIEDEADTLGEVDIETFPTLVVARGDRVLFNGPVLPQQAPALRLIAQCLNPDNPPPAIESADNLLLALRQLAGVEPLRR